MGHFLSHLGVLQSIKRQWPIYRPKAVVTDLDSWLAQRRAVVGWYGAQTDTVFIPKYDEEVRLLVGFDRDADHRHMQRRLWRIPHAGVLTLRDAYVFSDRGYVLSCHNEMINALGPGWSVDLTRNHSFPGRAFATFAWQISRVSGVSAVLACDGARSHYHFLLQLLPRIHLCRDLFCIIDRFIVPSYLSESQLAAIVHCGVEYEKLYQIRPGEKLQTDYLVAPSIPGDRGAVPTWVVEFLRAKWLRSAEPLPSVTGLRGSSKVYLYRGIAASRYVRDEAEIAAGLRERGFAILDLGSLSVQSQADALENASLIVAPHGAALTNIVFARANATVVELFHPEHVYTHYYQTLAEIMGFRYEAVVLGGQGHDRAAANLAAVLSRVDEILPRIA